MEWRYCDLLWVGLNLLKTEVGNWYWDWEMEGSLWDGDEACACVGWMNFLVCGGMRWEVRGGIGLVR